MLFSGDYSIKMPIGEALAVSLIGIITVILILGVIACLILLVSKAIRLIEAKAPHRETESPNTSPVPAQESIRQGEVELINTDEKTAAVIMAIVSEKSGIPLNRLSFKSIRLMEREKKGDRAHD